jgi:hypothetical protein
MEQVVITRNLGELLVFAVLENEGGASATRAMITFGIG